MRKSADAFRTISEVAEELDVPKHVLRFWEIKFPHIRPMKRGGGRRYYRPEDLELLSGIRTLLHADGYTIKGVQKILKEHGAEHVKAYGRGEVAVSAGQQISAAKAKAKSKSKTKSRLTEAKRASDGLAHANASTAHVSAIEAAIRQLEECRKLLTGSGAPNKTETKTRSRSARM